jgi:hypothetical protein
VRPRICAEDVWWLMHHSDDPAKQSMICYCDDSGSHEESRVAVVGSILLSKEGFIKLDGAWSKLINEFKIEGIHMRDFVRPHGRYVTMPHEMKYALFASVARAIILNRIYSVTASVPHADFKALLSPKIYRHVMGAYSMAFFATVLTNGTLAHVRHYNGRIGYLVDKGASNHHAQIDAAHTVVLGWEKHADEDSRYTGVLAFDLDDNNNALQAADVIAWTYHRKKELLGFGGEFAPLLQIFHPLPSFSDGLEYVGIAHIPLDYDSQTAKGLADIVNTWIAENGTMPASFVDLAART